MRAQGKLLDARRWAQVSDNVRGQARGMRSSMLMLNTAQPQEKQTTCELVFYLCWKKLQALDLACVNEDAELASNEYAEIIALLDRYLAYIS